SHTGSGACVQPVPATHASLVHACRSSQSRGPPLWHRPPAHASPTVQTSPSSHGFVLLTWPQVPAVQESVVHGLPSSQFFAAPRQRPPVQTSFSEQALPSSHVVPFGFAGFEHEPVAGLQTPASWHASLAVHPIGLLPRQAPAWHWSVWVQALL